MQQRTDEFCFPSTCILLVSSSLPLYYNCYMHFICTIINCTEKCIILILNCHVYFPEIKSKNVFSVYPAICICAVLRPSCGLGSHLAYFPSVPQAALLLSAAEPPIVFHLETSLFCPKHFRSFLVCRILCLTGFCLFYLIGC